MKTLTKVIDSFTICNGAITRKLKFPTSRWTKDNQFSVCGTHPAKGQVNCHLSGQPRAYLHKNLPTSRHRWQFNISPLISPCRPVQYVSKDNPTKLESSPAPSICQEQVYLPLLAYPRMDILLVA